MMKHGTEILDGMKPNLRYFFLVLIVASVTMTDRGFASLASPTSNGVEIGNARGDRGGFEIGNGSISNDIYKIKQIVGMWKVEILNKFTGFTAITSEEVKARGDIDLTRMEEIFTLDDLLRQGGEEGWVKVQVGNAEGIKKIEPVSVSGIRKLEYRLFKAPTEVVKITLAGPQGSPGVSAFDKFQRMLESLEIL